MKITGKDDGTIFLCLLDNIPHMAPRYRVQSGAQLIQVNNLMMSNDDEIHDRYFWNIPMIIMSVWADRVLVGWWGEEDEGGGGSWTIL